MVPVPPVSVQVCTMGEVGAVWIATLQGRLVATGSAVNVNAPFAETVIVLLFWSTRTIDSPGVRPESTPPTVYEYAQRPLVQRPEAQSVFAPQTLPPGQVGPHAGEAHAPLVQTPEAQSVFAPHPLVSAHVGAHAGVAQVPPVQTPEPQLPAAPQGAP